MDARHLVRAAVLALVMAWAMSTARAAGTGRLIVISGVAGAEVRLDGFPIGRTPLDQTVASGPHQLMASLAGYGPATLQVEIAADHENRVLVPLAPLPPILRVGWVVGVAAGADGLEAPRRVSMWTGVRDPSDHLEANVLFVGDRDAVSLGAEMRLYVANGRIRPYLRAAVLGPILSAEGGVGLALGQLNHASGRDFFYFIELDGRLRSGSFAVPLNVGVMARL